jgi:hypothetical protein
MKVWAQYPSYRLQARNQHHRRQPNLRHRFPANQDHTRNNQGGGCLHPRRQGRDAAASSEEPCRRGFFECLAACRINRCRE